MGSDVSRAVKDFEEEKAKLYRRDGSPKFAEKEHAERMGDLTGSLRKRVEGVVEKAEQDAREYETEARGLSYSDPTANLSAGDLSRLATTRALISEDCERLVAPALIQRLRDVSAGGDKVAKILHARYARFRLQALEDESERAYRDGRPDPQAAEKAARRREMEGAVAELEEQVKDRKTAEGMRELSEAAERSRQVALEARRRLMEADGTAAAARRSMEEHCREMV